MKSGAPLTYPEPIEQAFYMFMPFFRGRGRQVKRLMGSNQEYPAADFDSYPAPDRLVKFLLGDTIRDILMKGKYLELGFLNQRNVARMLESHMHGHGDYGKYLINLTTLALWIEQQSYNRIPESNFLLA